MTRNPAWNEARSIHLGVNRVDQSLYQGCLPDLVASEEDARQMRRLADAMGFSSRLFLSEDATRAEVVDCLESTIDRLADGDVLLVTYSGHMTSIPGVGDDRDGWDEAWCLRDGILLDDEFHDLLSDIPEGVDVIVVTDSCFSAGLVDGGSPEPDVRTDERHDRPPARGGGRPEEQPVHAVTPAGPRKLVASKRVIEKAGHQRVVARAPDTRNGNDLLARLVRNGVIPMGTPRPASRRRPISARVIALAAASEGTLAYEGTEMGYFTAAIVSAVEAAGDAPLTFQDLMEGVMEHLPGQRPSVAVFGGATIEDTRSGAFAKLSARPAPPNTARTTFGVPGAT